MFSASRNNPNPHSASARSFATSFDVGRADVHRLFREQAGRRVWSGLLFDSPFFCTSLGLLLGLFLFGVSAGVSVPAFVDVFDTWGPWRQISNRISMSLCAVFHRIDAGPRVFQDHPVEFVGCGVAFLVAGVLVAVLLRLTVAWIIDVPPPSVKWWRWSRWTRDFGRLFGLWEHWAGEEEPLRRKAVTGSQLLLLRVGVKAVCDVVRLTVFGWILVAADYGFHVLVMLAIVVLDSFSGLGLDIMIQRDGDDVIDRLPTYWTIQMIRGLALFALAWFAAPAVARFYAHELTQTRYSTGFFIWLTRALGSVFLLRGTMGFGRELRQRDMNYRSVVKWDISVDLLALAVSLVVLFVVRNVLALAVFFVVDAVGCFVISYVLFPWWPRLAWNRNVTHQILLSSSGIVGITVLNSVAGRIDHATVGKLLGMGALGFYGRAYVLASIPSHCFTNIVAPAMLPPLRTVREDPIRFRRAFLRTLTVYAVGVTGMAAVLAALAYPLVKYILGRNGYWLPLLPPFYVLLVFGVSRALGSLTPSVLFVLNKSWLVTLCTAIGAFGVAIGVYPMTLRFGTLGTAWTVVGASLLSNGLALYLVLRLTRAGLSQSSE